MGVILRLNFANLDKVYNFAQDNVARKVSLGAQRTLTRVYFLEQNCQGNAYITEEGRGEAGVNPFADINGNIYQYIGGSAITGQTSVSVTDPPSVSKCFNELNDVGDLYPVERADSDLPFQLPLAWPLEVR